ncbi:MAG: glycosyltransferase family 4 protein [Novosphingobium sp.]
MTIGDVAVFHPGTQHSWQTALALQQLGRLAWYATSIYHQPDRFPYVLERLPGPLGRKLGERLRRFRHPDLDPALIRTSGTIEWLERIAMAAGWRTLAHRLDYIGNERFGHGLRHAARESAVRAVWGYNASSASLFRDLAGSGKVRVLDRTTGDWRAYNAAMDRVAADYSEWFLDSERRISARQIARDQEEYALADAILCGSSFAADTVRSKGGSAAAGKVRVLPYCYDERLFDGLPSPRPIGRDEPVRFLFLGLAIPRKGIQHVLEAISRIPPSAAQLSIVGQLGIPREVFARYADRVDYRPTVARNEVPAILAAHHCLLFPSYFEGAGIVLYEALAAGCALIQSDRAAVAVTPASGLLLGDLSSDVLYQAMMTAVEDRDRLNGWRAAAQASAADYTFAGYRQRIAGLLDELLPDQVSQGR